MPRAKLCAECRHPKSHHRTASCRHTWQAMGATFMGNRRHCGLLRGGLVTLPGFEAIPYPAPTKTAAGYPDGWRFWALAGSVGRQQRGSEWVYLIRGADIREALVDLRTGAVIKWGERA